MKTAAGSTHSAAATPQPAEMLALLAEKCKELEAKVERCHADIRNNRAARFSPDDQIFLVWVLGFTAGAHIDRNGEQGERIFGRCRELWTKMTEAPGGNPS